MTQVINLNGQRFGCLTVIERSDRKTKYGGTHWVCQCDCAQLVIVRSDNLRNGRTTQCSVCRGGAGIRSVFVKEVMENGVV
jgi:predicted SprT family Zn-dependent metalloprotease